MGGASTEITPTSTELVLEAAHFDAVTVARQSRRHKLSSEASRRFERGVDPALPPYATARAANLLVELGGAHHVGFHEVDLRSEPPTVTIDVRHPGRVAGIDYPDAIVLRRLADVGCEVVGPDADQRAGRDAASVAAGPHRPQRPRRGGHPARGLRPGAVHAAPHPGGRRPHARADDTGCSCPVGSQRPG